MSLIYSLASIIDDSRREYEDFLRSFHGDEPEILAELLGFQAIEMYGLGNQEKSGILAKSDNLTFMKWLISKDTYKGNIKLIYVDPPFFSKADYEVQVKIHTKISEKPVSIKQIVYSDTWKEGIESYLRMICIRLFVMRDLLSEEGCIWMHLDWHVAHYVKILMDEIFGRENFINEVIWNYKSGGTSNRRFARKHDTLLFYGKTKDYFFEAQKEKSYNRGLKPYRFKGVEEYEDHLGWYTLVNMKDVWQMDMVGRTSAERTGYATQKPEALLERILKSCTKEGDLCADFFGGSGTLAATASRMNRRWITSDIGGNAVAGMKKRFLKNGIENVDFKVMDKWTENQEVEVTCEKSVGEKGLYTVTLQSYRMKEELLEIFRAEDQTLLRRILAEDSLSLVDYWSVDFHYHGKIYRPQCAKLREKGILEETIEEFSVQDLAERKHTEEETNHNHKEKKSYICVSCVDVFGNVSHKIL